MAKPRIVCICGTRPDAIKTAPVALELRKYDSVDTVLVSTGQHREMLAQALGAFGLTPDHDLEIMTHGQTLAQVTTRALEGIDRLLVELEPQMVVAQGDTTTTFVASLAAFYRRIPFAHVEAGLRTESVDNPFPEEFNRRTTGQLARLHFAPTSLSAANLLKERAPADKVFVTGNTGIDALHQVIHQRPPFETPAGLRPVLLTTHRRENWGQPLRDIATAALRLLEAHSDIVLYVPMHKNPLVRETLVEVLGKHERARLVEPPEYAEFATWLKAMTLILTDSGGVQEEAPTFGVPVLVLRETTERPEGVDAGVAKLIGTDPERIYAEASLLLTDTAAHAAMAQARSPYGDGKASQRIRYLLLRELGLSSPEEPMWT